MSLRNGLRNCNTLTKKAMTKKIKINNVEVSIEDFRKAMEENKELLERKSRVIERVGGGEYWCILSNGGVSWATDLFLDGDNYRYLTGNYFLTQQEAENHKAYLEALGRVRLAIRESNNGREPDWEDTNTLKYYVYFDRQFNNLKVSSTFYYPLALGYILSDAAAELITRTHKDDLLLVFNYKQ